MAAGTQKTRTTGNPGKPAQPVDWRISRRGAGIGRGLTVAAAIVAALATLSGCAAVKAYERDVLADPIMERQDFFAKQSLEQKFFSTREGSIGGAAGIGGGCGCAK